MLDATPTGSVKGPHVYENWRAYLEDKSLLELSEFPLFSDARVTGEELNAYKPYIFLNPVPSPEDRGCFRPIVYVRIGSYLEFHIPDMSKTNTEGFHGGTLIDELAALVSLALGIRIRAGAMSRFFHDNTDSQGHPVGWIKQPEFLTVRYQRLVIPNAIGERPLSLLSPLSNISLMSPEAANALIKAARSYQKALLIAEEDPSMSWLFLVAAIEKAASYWWSGEEDKVKALRDLKPKLIAKLDPYEKSAEIISIIAEEIYNLVGSTKKFTEFLLEFIPQPPRLRPKGLAQVDWKPSALKKAFNTIYDHRSKALHEATPFPMPMCDPVWREKDATKAWHEKPWAKAYSSPGGTWLEGDYPMFLNTFEYIVRNSLIKWSVGLTNKQNSN